MTSAAIRSVVIGTDFGESASSALRWVGRHLAPGAGRIVVHVMAPDPAMEGDRRLAGGDVAVRIAREVAERRLAAALASVNDLRSRGEIREGEITREIVAVACRSKADLIVLGTSGRDRLVGDQVGTTAERLLDASPVPVLVSFDVPEDAPRTLLVAVDESEPATRALRWAHLLSERLGTRVVALHALSVFGTDLLQRVSRTGSVRQEEELQLEKGRNWLRHRVLSAGFSPEELCLRVVLGDPRVEVPAAAHHLADLVVMGDHGTGRHRPTPVGSVTRAVLRDASCPVFVVPDPEKSGPVRSGISPGPAGSPIGP